VIQLQHNIEILATVFFACALVHTFATGLFNKAAAKYPSGGIAENFLHFLGEVEVVFGIWAAIFLVAFGIFEGSATAIGFLESLSFTEPAFVFAIMVVASTKPVLTTTSVLMDGLATMVTRLTRLPGAVPFFLILMTVGPLAGSFITEPAAMTLTALILQDRIFSQDRSTTFKYATLGLLFVNISIGGVLTPFAAPPVVMVAGKWNWDLAFMASNFGWKATIAVLINTILYTLYGWRELARIPQRQSAKSKSNSRHRLSPPWLVFIHVIFLAGIVVYAHHMTVFCGLLLIFIGVTEITNEHQDRLRLRESLLVAFFLAGLVVLGKGQEWWLRPLLESAGDRTLFWGATALTAITDNAALTYLASQVNSLSASAKYAVVAGAVTGGGLTVIANAPNPAGHSILKNHFGKSGIEPLKLLAAAAVPTIVAAFCFGL
jgi:hypothetical protein